MPDIKHVYVYSPDNEDYSTIGECGALPATSCALEEIGNGLSEITLEHPLDSMGKYLFLQNDAVLKVWVPVRTTPEIENGEFITRVENWTVSQTATKRQRYVYSKKEKGKKIKTLAKGAVVTVTGSPADSGRWKIKSGKTSGWMDWTGLENGVEMIVPESSNGIESAAPAWESREQLFRIYKVAKSSSGGITCSARHMSYDLMYNMTTYDTDASTTLQESGGAILENCLDPHDFTFHTNISGTKTGAHYIDTDPITAFLNPESGLIAAWDAQLVRDNFELTALASAGMDRGIRIEYAKNLIGVDMDEDMSNAVTCVLPVGKKKDGSPLYLEGDHLVRPENAGNWPHERIYKLECTDCEVGKNGVDTSTARARMLEQANALLEAGVNMPTVSARVTFANLGNVRRYEQYRALENVYLFDTVYTWHPRLGIDIKTYVNRIMWDCLRQKMISMDIGVSQVMTPSVASWQVPNGINGSKLVYGSIGPAQLGTDAISARHIQADSINADAVQAETFTSEKASVGALTAINAAIANLNVTDELYANFAHIFELVANQIEAGNVETDVLAAQLAEIVSLTASVAEIGYADIKDLTTDEAIITDGVAGSLYINRLMVTSANILNATLGNLVLKGNDGQYYNVFIGSDGNISTTPVSVTDGEITSGKTESGMQIVDEVINVQEIAAQNIKGKEAIFESVFTKALSAGQITANQAMLASAVIPNLTVSTITAAGNSIKVNAGQIFEILLNGVQNLNQWFGFGVDGLTIRQPEITKPDGEVIPQSDWYTVTDNRGYHIKNATRPEDVGSFELDRFKTEAIQMGDMICRPNTRGGWTWRSMK